MKTKMLFRFVFLLLLMASQGSAQSLQAETKLSTVTHPTLGDYLTDGDGKTLYIFLDDIDGSSHCYDACATQWPPFLSSEPPMAEDNLVAGMLSVTPRKDGTQQVTYSGYPHYYFAGDIRPGDMKGQNWEDRWYVLSPRGYRLANEVEGEVTE